MGSTESTPRGFLATDFWPFTQEQLTDFRLQWLRDMVAVNAVPEIEIIDGGSDYEQGEPIVVTNDNDDTTGSGLTGYVNVTDGVITSVKITNPGSLYTIDPGIDVLNGTDGELVAHRSTIKLSGWNKATGQEFFSDSDLNSLLYNLLIDKRSEMMAAYYAKLNEDIYSPYPADEADAEVSALHEQLLIIYRFLRADCREAMLNDPGFRGAVPDHAREEFFEQWGGAIIQDRNWARQRTGGFASVSRRQK